MNKQDLLDLAVACRHDGADGNAVIFSAREFDEFCDAVVAALATAPAAGAPVAISEQLTEAIYDLLTDLSGVDTYDTNLRDSTQAHEFVEYFVGRLAPQPAASLREQALIRQAYGALSLMLSYHGQGTCDYADVAQVKAQEALDAIDAHRLGREKGTA